MTAQATTPTGQSTIVLALDEGEPMWFNNDLLTVKATGGQTDGGFLLLEELARRGKVTPLHTHPTETESFYMLSGEALFHIDGAEGAVESGGFVSVPPGVPHAYLVTSESARTLVLITPGNGSMESFFRDAGEPAAKLELPPEGPLDIERIGAAAERSGAVKILGPPPFQEPQT